MHKKVRRVSFNDLAERFPMIVVGETVESSMTAWLLLGHPNGSDGLHGCCVVPHRSRRSWTASEKEADAIEQKYHPSRSTRLAQPMPGEIWQDPT